LVRSDIISQENHYCVSGCGQVESARHLFLHCKLFCSLRQLVRSWIAFYSVEPQHILDHFIRFPHVTWGYHAHRNFLQLLWLASVWVLWTERNNRFFKFKERSTMQLLDKVKMISFLWLKIKALFGKAKKLAYSG
jgi:hypothetical protein